MATLEDAEKIINELIEIANKGGGWVEYEKKSIRSGKVNIIEIKISIKVT